MADFGQVMLARIAAAKGASPTAVVFKPELQAAANEAARSAAVRRTPVRALVDATAYNASLRFTGPGAAHADAVARKRLARTVPEATERIREDLRRRLRGRS